MTTPDISAITKEHGIPAARAHLDASRRWTPKDEASAAANGPDQQQKDSATNGAAEVISAPVVFKNDWAGPIPDRPCTVKDRLYRGAAAILSGDGGIGKTTIALQLAVGVVCNFAWLNAVVEHSGPVLFYTAEEDDNEIKRRVRRIVEHHNLSSDEVLRDLHRHCRVGEDAVLGAPDKNKIIQPSPLFAQLTEQARDLRAACVIIEAAADVFAGDEINRSQVRQFMGLLRGLAVKIDGSVLLLQHPSLTGMTSGTGTSGSTHWRNCARPFMHFSAADKDDLRMFEVNKINYGPKSGLQCQWKNGVFVPIGAGNPIERAAAEAPIDDAFLKCLDAATAQKRSASPNKGITYAPAVFEGMPEAAGFNRKALGPAMERLLAAGRIKSETKGPASRLKTQLVRC
jgi:RecA-family ATPase